MKSLLTVSCLFLMTNLFAQNHNDVAVIINQNSPISIAIGEYFQTQRDIPAANIIRIDAPSTEAISVTELPAIFEQVKNHITTNNLEESLNYLVTTKGLPLMIELGEDCEEPNICKHSLESKLSFLFSEQEAATLEGGGLINPYFGTDSPFSRTAYDMFLVSRLDAYTQESVFRLIDNSASQIVVSEEEASIVLDLVNVEEPATLNFFDDNYMELQEHIISSNWNNILYDANITPVSTQENISWYHTTGFGPYDFFEPSMNWMSGAVAMLHTCKSAQTFEPHSEGKLYLVDLIEAGATGGLGFVENTYVSNLVPVNFFNAYFLEERNLAEANYRTIRRLSNAFIMIGDPKTSIVVESPNGTKAPIISELTVYPNPSAGQFIVDLSAEMGKIESIEVFNTLGALVYKNTYVEQEGLSAMLDLDGFANGMYQAILRTEGGVYQQSLVIE